MQKAAKQKKEELIDTSKVDVISFSILHGDTMPSHTEAISMKDFSSTGTTLSTGSPSNTFGESHVQTCIQVVQCDRSLHSCVHVIIPQN